MTDQDAAVDGYVEDVLSRLPPAAPGRERVASDLRTHLEEAISAGGSAEEAVREMGPARETAAGYAEGLGLEPASLGDRTGAFLVDVGLGLALSAAAYLSSLASGTPLGLEVAAAWPLLLFLLGGLLAVLYFPALETLYGQTLGKRIFGLCVARDDGLRAEWWRTVVRRLPLFFEVFWLDALFAPFTERRQRAFDIVAGTIVVPGEERGGRALGWALALLLCLGPVLLVYVLGNAMTPVP